MEYIKNSPSSPRSLRSVPDLVLEEVIHTYYTYGTVAKVLSVRTKSRRTLSYLENPSFSFDPISQIGLNNLTVVFLLLDTFTTDEVRRLFPDELPNPHGQDPSTGKELNMRGKFKMTDENGNMVRYESSDVVYYDGKTYIASDSVSGCVPSNYAHPDCSAWSPIDLPDNTVGYEESGF
jgi:hypothetical protein